MDFANLPTGAGFCSHPQYYGGSMGFNGIFYLLAMTNSLLLKPWPSRIFVSFPNYKMVDLSSMLDVPVYQRVVENDALW